MALMQISHPTTRYTLFSALTFGAHQETIKVRVTRIWDAMSYRMSDDVAAHFILLDEKDSQILAIAEMQERTRLQSELHEGIVYYIANFKIVAGPTKFKPVATDRAILFNKQTNVWPCFDICPIAKMKFELCPFEDVAPRLEDSTDLMDISGILFSVGNILHNNHGVQKLIIQLIDESGSIVIISLWGNKATQFDMKFEVHRRKNVVMVVTGLLPKCSKGRIWLASTSATKSYFNPTYKDLEALRNIVASRFGEFICRLPSTEAYENLYPIGVQKICLTIEQVKEPTSWVRPKLLAKQTFFCKVTIKDILSCEHLCFQPIDVDDPVHLSGSLRTVILAADSSGTAKLILKRHELELLTGLTTTDLLTHLAEKHVKDVNSLPPQLKCIRDTLCTFEVENPTNNEGGDIGEIIIKSIIESSKLVRKRKQISYLTHVEKKLRQAPLH